MNKYSAKKIVVLAILGLAVLTVASIAFAGDAFAAAPDVETRPATEIHDDSARLNGYLYTEGEDTVYWFEYGTNRNNLNRDTSERFVDDRDGRVTVYNTIQNGLIEDEIYYFRLVAENDDGISRGEIRSFRADNDSDEDSGDLYVETGSVQHLNSYVVLNGEVDSDSSYVQVWFRYGKSSGSLSSNTPTLTIFGSADRSFSNSVYGLSPNTTYYFQAVARNGDGTEYGDVRNFTTNNFGSGGNGNGGFGSAPLVNSNSALSVGTNSATLRAQVNPNGNLSSVWFEYGRTTALGGLTTRDPAGSGSSYADYSANLSGLSAGTTYYYRAAAQNSSGTTRGQILSFRTQGNAPVQPPTTPVNPGNGGSTPPISVVTTTPVGATGCFNVSPVLSSPQLQPGQEFTYSLTYRNDCGYALSNSSLQVTLPMATEYAGTNYPFLTRDANVITYNLGVIAPNFQSAVIIEGMVRSGASSGESMIFESNVTFTDPRGVLQNASGYISAMVFEDGSIPENGTSTLAASIADAFGGLFHSGWFWLVLFLVIIALFVLWLATRRRVTDEDEDGEEEAAHGH